MDDQQTDPEDVHLRLLTSTDWQSLLWWILGCRRLQRWPVVHTLYTVTTSIRWGQNCSLVVLLISNLHEIWQITFIVHPNILIH